MTPFDPPPSPSATPHASTFPFARSPRFRPSPPGLTLPHDPSSNSHSALTHHSHHTLRRSHHTSANTRNHYICRHGEQHSYQWLQCPGIYLRGGTFCVLRPLHPPLPRLSIAPPLHTLYTLTPPPPYSSSKTESANHFTHSHSYFCAPHSGAGGSPQGTVIRPVSHDHPRCSADTPLSQ